MNASTEHNDDNNGVEQDSLTHPPLLDKHCQFDMFSTPGAKQNDDKNACSTPPKPGDDPTLDIQNQLPKKVEPVLGKERAIKILKAFGSQQKPVKEFYTNVLKTPTKDSNKPKREKKSLTPLEKAKETISQIEELKKFKDRTIPTYFGENVVIHHIRVEHPPTEPKSDNHKSESIEKISKEIVGPKIPVDSLEALKVYNNLDVDKQSDEDVNSDNEEPLLSSDLLDECLKKRKLPAAFDLKTKRGKEKRIKRTSLDSRSSDKKRKRRNKDRRKRRTRDVSSRRSSTSSSKKRPKRRRDSNRDTEIPSDKRISSEKRISLDSQSRDYQFERFTKTLPVIKYSANPHVIRQLLTNGIVDKSSEPKKKKRLSSSKSAAEKRKQKKSSDRSTEKQKVKRRRRSGSKADRSGKKRRRELDRSNDDAASKTDREKLADDVPTKVNDRTMDGKSPNSEEYQSNWDNWDSVEATDEMTGSSMENLLQLDTIPLQLNVPKQDRTILFMNDCCAKISEQINQTTPRMDKCDPTMETPIIVDFTAGNSALKGVENGKLSSPMTCSVSKLYSDNSLDNYISKISPKQPITKRNEQSKSSQLPIAQLYDEYDQFIMSCMPASNENHTNGDKSSISSSLYDETVTSNDGDEKLEAIKKSLEKKLHEIEHTDSNDTVKMKVSEQTEQIANVLTESPIPPSKITNESSDSSESSSSSSSSSDSSSSTTSSSSDKQRKKKTRKQNAHLLPLTLDENIFNLKTGIEDDELSDDELLSKVELLKQQFSEKRKELANKRKLVAYDTESPESGTNTVGTDALVSAEKRSAISLKIGGNKPNAIMKPVMLDDDDFTEKLMLEVTPTSLARSKETNKLLIERVIEPGVGLVSSSNSNSLASEIINTKVSRIGMMPNNPIMSDIFPKSNKSVPIEHAVVKITSNETVPIDTAEMKKYLNNASSHLDRSDSVVSKTSSSIESSKLHDSSPTRQLASPSRSDKRNSSNSNSKNRTLSPYSRSRTKESSKRYSSPQPRHRSPRSRKRSSYRSPSPIRKRSRGSPRRSRSPRKSPRRASPRRIRRSLSPRSKRTVSPVRGKPRTPPMPEKHTKKWEPPHSTDYTSSTKNVLACDDNVPQPICRLETTHATSWPDERNSAFAQYTYQHMQQLSPKSYDFHRASGPYMGHVQYSTENTSKIPVLNSQENYYFQPHVPPQNMQALPPQPITTQHAPRLHVPPMHVSHIAPNQLSPQTLSVQHPPPPQQRIFPNLIEIRQSNVNVERTPFVVKGNVLEIVPKTEAVVLEQLINSKVEDENCYEGKQDNKIELTEEEIERREVRKAELKLKRKQERDKRHLERFMRKEKLRLEIKHLVEVGVHPTDVKKATYNPNAIGGKSILRGNATSANKKSVLFADGVAPGDGTSTSGGEDAPLRRDRNKRMTKKKLDSKRRRARREASTIKKETVPQVSEITPFLDPEIENMPPPPPPTGNPPARLRQPKLKSTPKLIYFHYDPKNNTMCISPFPTDVNIPSYPSNDSPPAASTPDLIQKPKVCFIQPPTFEQPSAPVNPSLPNQNTSTQNNSVGSTELVSPTPPTKSFNQQHQQPSSNSLPSSPALYPSSQVHSPQNFRGPPPIINQQSVPSQPSPMQMQASPMASQWENYPPNTPIQQQPCPQSWEPDVYPHNPAIRPHIRFNNGNNIVQPRPVHNLWDQQRHSNPMYQNQIHSPQHQQQPPAPPQPAFLPRPNHPRFHQNQPVNVVASHQPHNNFAFNSKYNYNANSNHSWNNQYRNNH